MNKPKPEILVIHESVWHSFVRDATTFLMAVSIIGVGVLLASTAMQWVGAIVFFLAVAGTAAAHKNRMTIEEARKRIDELEATL
ncbi:hypothetical protein [Mesorhizobium sp. DCY119]|uniref:hypothetical protein n=1 Tax=Mesorhizobium sp. DCY119 TaxID=2108445 RepID=UPI000E6CAF18|nr:hypothetical protein [Mesorhizobium sp. DCY119]RJG46540.1 hypothetical protein D3Y55_21335 [Mesorhizobium sp. DCY119]